MPACASLLVIAARKPTADSDECTCRVIQAQVISKGRPLSLACCCVTMIEMPSCSQNVPSGSSDHWQISRLNEQKTWGNSCKTGCIAASRVLRSVSPFIASAQNAQCSVTISPNGQRNPHGGCVASAFASKLTSMRVAPSLCAAKPRRVHAMLGGLPRYTERVGYLSLFGLSFGLA